MAKICKVVNSFHIFCKQKLIYLKQIYNRGLGTVVPLDENYYNSMNKINRKINQIRI